MAHLRCLTISQRTAMAELRQRFALSHAECREIYQRVRSACPAAEVLILSTCNRTEIYVADANEADTSVAEIAAVAWAEVKALDAGEFARVQELAGLDAVRHLCQVAAGLESVVLGETQILAQLKAAFETATLTDAIGPALHGIAHLAFKVGRRARSETRIAEGRVSVASAGVDVARDHLGGTLAGKTALLIGAGKIGRLTVRHLLDADVARLIVANRTAENAAVLAAEAKAAGVAALVVSLDAVREFFADADVIATALATPSAACQPIFASDSLVDFRAACRAETRARVILDFGVPANVDPLIGEWPGIVRVGVDDLDRATSASRAIREAAVPAVHQIIDAELAAFADPHGAMGRQMLDALFRQFSDMTRCEVGKQLQRGVPGNADQLDEFAQRLMRKLLAPVAQRFRKGRRGAEILGELEWLKNVFALDAGPFGTDDSGEDSGESETEAEKIENF